MGYIENGSKQKQHTISLLVNNKPGVLIRIALIFARRGYNIDSLVVCPGKEKRFSRMTITASGDAEVLSNILKQLNKLVDVIHATDHTDDIVIERELALIKLKCLASQRTEILEIANHFKCKSVDLGQEHIILECSGTSEKLDALITLLSGYEIIEMMRTGKIVMLRGQNET